MKKYFIIILMFCITIVNAQDSDLISSENTKSTNFYVTTNILSPLAGANTKNTIINVLSPLLSNMEYGYTISCGVIKKYHSFETRITLGQSNPYTFVPQFQLGYNLFVFDYLHKKGSGWYVGAFARYWDYYNKYSKIGFQNITTNFNLGYMWKKSNFIADFRINQPITIYTFSNLEHTKSAFNLNLSSMPYFLPVMPALSLNLGFKF